MYQPSYFMRHTHVYGYMYTCTHTRARRYGVTGAVFRLFLWSCLFCRILASTHLYNVKLATRDSIWIHSIDIQGVVLWNFQMTLCVFGCVWQLGYMCFRNSVRLYYSDVLCGVDGWLNFMYARTSSLNREVHLCDVCIRKVLR